MYLYFYLFIQINFDVKLKDKASKYYFPVHWYLWNFSRFYTCKKSLFIISTYKSKFNKNYSYILILLYIDGLLFRGTLDGLKRDDYESWFACVQCSPIRSCFFPVLSRRAVANFGMSAALRPVLGAFQPSPPAPLREKKAPSESCWPVDFRMDAVSLYRLIPSVSLLRAGCVLHLSHMTANNVCICATQCFFTRWPLYRSFRKFDKIARKKIWR